MTHAGQAGIRFRERLLARDLDGALAAAAELDEPHRIELLLGGALRDARDDFAGAHAWLRGDLPRVLASLLDPDLRYDHLAAAWVAAGRAPERWHATGHPLDRPLADDEDAAAALSAGVAGEAVLDAFAHLPLHPAVAAYYRQGTLHALGCRPLLVLAATAGPPPAAAPPARG